MATAPIGPLAWESPYATEAAQEMAKRQKKKKGFRIVTAVALVIAVAGVRSLAWELPHVVGAAKKKKKKKKDTYVQRWGHRLRQLHFFKLIF